MKIYIMISVNCLIEQSKILKMPKNLNHKKHGCIYPVFIGLQNVI